VASVDLQPKARRSVLGQLTLGLIYFKWLQMWGMENPKRFGFYL
jgi:hypothetical protein